MVVVLLDNSASHFIAIFASREEIEISQQVVVLDGKSFTIFWYFHSPKHVNSFSNSILKLKVVDKNHFVLVSEVFVYNLLLYHAIKELIVRLSESLVQNGLLPVFAKAVSSRVDQRMIFQKLCKSANRVIFGNFNQRAAEVSAKTVHEETRSCHF